MGVPPRYQPGEVIPGTTLRVVRHLGDGGMGSVFSVIETSIDAPFVIKIVHPHLLAMNGGRVAQSLDREARRIAKLQHRNIVRVYRAGVTSESPPVPYYVMDLLTGYTVQQLLKWHQGKGLQVPLSWVFWIGAGLFSALDHAHGKGIVHRDVKPANVFIDQPEQQRPVIKLLDFGVAEVLSEFTEGARLTQGFAGTYTHAAPEQLRGAPANPLMDLYAAGVVLFELIAASHPFPNAKDFESMAEAHLNEAPAPLREFRQVHPRLESLVYALLAKNPAARPPSARAAFQELNTAKTEWVQQGTISGSTSGFQLEIELGEPWVRNMERDVGFTLERGEAMVRKSSPSASENDTALLRVPPFSPAGSAGRRSAPALSAGAPLSGSGAPTPAMWGKTVSARSSRSVKFAAILLGGVLLVLAAGTAGYRLLIRHDGQQLNSSDSTAAAAIAPTIAPALPQPSALPASSAMVPEVKAPVSPSPPEPAKASPAILVRKPHVPHHTALPQASATMTPPRPAEESPEGPGASPPPTVPNTERNPFQP